MDDKEKIKAVLDSLAVNLSIADVAELVRFMKEEYGIEATAAVIATSYGYSDQYPADKTLFGQIYLDTEEDTKAVEIYSALKELLSAFKVEVTKEGEIVKGSWLRKFEARPTECNTKEEVELRLKKIEQALESSQMDADVKQAEAVERLLKSLTKVKNAAIKIGSLLLIKITNSEGEENVVALTVSTEKLKFIDRNPHLLGNPTQLLANLTESQS